MRDITLRIEGMSCGHCLNAVNQALHQLPGVEIESVQIGRAVLKYDENQTGPDAITGAVDEAGYSAQVV